MSQRHTTSETPDAPTGPASPCLQNEQRYAAIKNKNNPRNPYYRDRGRPQFIDTHLALLAELQGQTQAETIASRLLRVTIPGSEQTLCLPTINLLPSGVRPSLAPTLAAQPEPGEVPASFIAAVVASGTHITDNPTFTLQQLDQATGRMHCGMSSYFRAIFQCDQYQYQIAARFPGLAGDLHTYRQHAFLQDWSQQLAHIVCNNDFSHIEASLGCACLLVTNSASGYTTRLSHKANHANSMNNSHVIPALMFQPVGNDPSQYHLELDIRWQVLRELAEELFGMDEASAGHTSAQLHAQLMQQAEIADLTTLLARGDAEFHVTGLYLDLFRLRPEILTTLIIHDPAWSAAHLPAGRTLGNWEMAPQGIVTLAMTDRDFAQALRGEHGDLCAPGAAAYIEGYRTFQRIMAQQARTSRQPER